MKLFLGPSLSTFQSMVRKWWDSSQCSFDQFLHLLYKMSLKPTNVFIYFFKHQYFFFILFCNLVRLIFKNEFSPEEMNSLLRSNLIRGSGSVSQDDVSYEPVVSCRKRGCFHNMQAK